MAGHLVESWAVDWGAWLVVLMVALRVETTASRGVKMAVEWVALTDVGKDDWMVVLSVCDLVASMVVQMVVLAVK